MKIISQSEHLGMQLVTLDLAQRLHFSTPERRFLLFSIGGLFSPTLIEAPLPRTHRTIQRFHVRLVLSQHVVRVFSLSTMRQRG